jgi:hypothetical protein
MLPRFNQILFSLHVKLDAQISSEERSSDIFAKIRPLLDELCASFTSAYQPCQPIAIDEQTIAYKGRRKAKQKPRKWGFRNFALCDSKTGFRLSFKLYGGKDQSRPRNEPLANHIVKELVYPSLRKGHILVSDNWWLHMEGVKFVGTIRTNRKGWPSST